MVDRIGTFQIGEQALALGPTQQPLQSLPHRSVPPRGRLPVTAARLPSRPGGSIPTLCPNCSSRGERDDDTTRDLDLNGEDASSVCDLCGRVPAGGHALPRSTGIVEPGSVVEFVNIHDASGKPDGKTVNQVRGYIMRRIHQARRESQRKPLKMSPDNKKALRPSRSCTCPDQETWEDDGLRRPSVRTVLGSGRSDPFLGLSMPNVPKRYHELVDYCKQISDCSFCPPNALHIESDCLTAKMSACESVSDAWIFAPHFSPEKDPDTQTLYRRDGTLARPPGIRVLRCVCARMAANHLPESHRPECLSLYCIRASRNTPRSRIAFAEDQVRAALPQRRSDSWSQ